MNDIENIKIAGFSKTTFIDWPGKIASIIFLGGCNMRCYFCHNFDILCGSSNTQKFSEVLDQIREQVGFIDGVVISGGEATMHPYLLKIIDEIRALGLPIKLDSNGTDPGLLRELVEDGKIEYVAMDVKCAIDNHEKIVGTDAWGAQIVESINYLKFQDKIEYMFRTTMAPGVDEDDMIEIANMIDGATTYQMQQFIPNENSNASAFRLLPPYTLDQVTEFSNHFKGRVGEILIRGF